MLTDFCHCPEPRVSADPHAGALYCESCGKWLDKPTRTVEEVAAETEAYLRRKDATVLMVDDVGPTAAEVEELVRHLRSKHQPLVIVNKDNNKLSLLEILSDLKGAERYEGDQRKERLDAVYDRLRLEVPQFMNGFKKATATKNPVVHKLKNKNASQLAKLLKRREITSKEYHDEMERRVGRA